jgi:hypothetical protein
LCQLQRIFFEFGPNGDFRELLQDNGLHKAERTGVVFIEGDYMLAFITDHWLMLGCLNLDDDSDVNIEGGRLNYLALHFLKTIIVGNEGS